MPPSGTAAARSATPCRRPSPAPSRHPRGNPWAFRPQRPAQVLALGDEDLLTMDMTAAAAYWGVPVPIGKRDRERGARKKSGARKRKQKESNDNADSPQRRRRNESGAFEASARRPIPSSFEESFGSSPVVPW